MPDLYNIALYHFNPYGVPAVVTSMTLIAFGVSVVIREGRSKVSILFLLLTIFCSIWQFNFAMMYFAIDEPLALYWSKLAYRGVPFIAPSIFHFTMAALRLDRRYAWWIRIQWALGAIFSFQIVTTNSVVYGVSEFFWGYYTRYTLWAIPFLAFFLGSLASSMIVYARALRRPMSRVEHLRIRAIMAAFAVGYTGVIDYLPAYGVEIYPFGYMSVLGFIFLSGRAIHRYRLYDITAGFAADRILETIHDAIVVFDAEGVIHVTNPAANDLFRDGRLEGRNVRELKMDELQHPERLSVDDTSFDIRWRATDGEFRDIEVSLASQKGRDGRPIAWVAVFHDVTERQQAVRERLDMEAQFRSVTESATDAIIIADESGNIRFLNSGAKRIFGFASAEMIGKPLTALMPGRYIDAHQKGLARVRSGEPSHLIGKSVELFGVRNNGEEFPLELSLSTWTAGQNRYFGAIIRDTSARKKLEQDLIQTQKMESIGRIAGGVAHDMNNMLAVILPLAQLLKLQMKNDPEAVESIDMIEKTARRAADLVKQLLLFSRRAPLNMGSLEINRLLQDMQKILGRVLGKNIDIALRLDPSVGNIEADGTQMQQILMNLAVNARDAMPHGGRLTIATEKQMMDGVNGNLKKGPAVRLTVTDTGTGISQENISKIFEVFFSTKPPGVGTGLGLAVVKSIVSSHGGTIDVTSELGRGTTFVIHLPIIPAGEVVTTDQVPSIHKGNHELILVVDDEEHLLVMYQNMLHALGYRCLAAGSGQAALGILEKNHVDLAIIDLQMPGMDGRSTAHLLRQIRPDIRFLYVTGYVPPEVLEAIESQKEARILSKPLTMEQIAGAIKEALG